jgi:glycosyltransferase involved in cell wall biosynthesis
VNTIRPVFIIDRFWPLFDGAVRTLGDLAIELRKRGMPGTILTARWREDWPQRVTFHGMAVHRLMAPPPLIDNLKARWATARYIRAITAWLRQNRELYDIVFVSRLRHEAYAATTAFGSDGVVPVILRDEQPGRDGDCLWQLDAPGGRRLKRRTMKANAFVAPSSQIQKELIAAGYDRKRIHYIPHATRVVEQRLSKEKQRKTARNLLSASSSNFQMPSWAPLAVFTGRLVAENRLDAVIAAWAKIVARWPNAHLWIAGEGPERSMLQAQIHNLNLAERVKLIGSFDSVDDLLAAADVFVQPSPQEDLPVAVLEAMAAGLPVVVSNSSSNRDLITHTHNGFLFEHTNLKTSNEIPYPTLEEALFRLFDDRDLALRLGEAARKTAAERFDLAKCVDSYITLFEQLFSNQRNVTQP